MDENKQQRQERKDTEERQERKDKQQRQERFKTDTTFLLQCVGDELRKYDRYRRGLVSAEAFSSALRSLDIDHGSPEMSTIMQFCAVTTDGYVHYKYLLIQNAPAYKWQSYIDSVGEAITSQQVELQDKFADPTLLTKQQIQQLSTAERSDLLRRAYSHWDKGRLRDHQLVNCIQALGLEVSEEAKRLLASFGPSRTLPFSKLVQALHINDFNAYRKMRNPYPSMHLFPRPKVDDQSVAFHPCARNVINWLEPAHVSSSALPSSSAFLPTSPPAGRRTAYLRNTPSSESLSTINHSNQNTYPNEAICDPDTGEVDPAKFAMKLKQLTSDFVEALIPSTLFRLELAKIGIPITYELDALVRAHDSDNSVPFNSILQCLLRTCNIKSCNDTNRSNNICSNCRNLSSNISTDYVHTHPPAWQYQGGSANLRDNINIYHKHIQQRNDTTPRSNKTYYRNNNGTSNDVCIHCHKCIQKDVEGEGKRVSFSKRGNGPFAVDDDEEDETEEGKEEGRKQMGTKRNTFGYARKSIVDARADHGDILCWTSPPARTSAAKNSKRKGVEAIRQAMGPSPSERNIISWKAERPSDFADKTEQASAVCTSRRHFPSPSPQFDLVARSEDGMWSHSDSPKCAVGACPYGRDDKMDTVAPQKIYPIDRQKLGWLRA